MTKSRYLLPGECNSTSSIVHTHGTDQIESANASKQTVPSNFNSIPRIYEPKEKDFVVGIVIVRTPDLFLVDINSSEAAILPMTSFDSGRIPPRTAMNRLSVVFARVVRADSWLQTELSCQTPDNSKRKNEYGVQDQGYVIRCSLGLCKKLLNFALINQLKRIIKNFQMRVSHNGFVWILTDTINSMIAVKNVLYKYEYENNIDELIKFYNEFMDKLEQQDNNLVQVKRQKQPIVKKDVAIKIPEKPKPESAAMTNVLTHIVQSVLDQIIEKIEKELN